MYIGIPGIVFADFWWSDRNEKVNSLLPTLAETKTYNENTVLPTLSKRCEIRRK
jgi:hypothetical protein